MAVRLLPRAISFYGAAVMNAFPLDMSQYANLLRSTRVPKLPSDELKVAPTASHIVVQRRGRLWRLDVLDARGTLLGAGSVAPGAGDLIAPLGLVIAGQVKLSTLASQIVPYPTHADVPKRMAGAHLAPALFAKRTRRLISLLLKLPA